ncbi:MAG: YncE family protein [Actinomycetota bacterium]|nr:YncE family protein [Actinomycetota bacterium]
MRILRVLVALILVAGCGAKPPQPPAAEPADAPEQRTEPAGQVIRIGPLAEGMVADPVTHLVAVGVRQPPALQLVDGRTGVAVQRTPLPGFVRHLQLEAPGGPVLVPAESADELLRVDLPRGRIVSRVGVGDFPHDATATEAGTVLVANEFGGTISVVRDNQVVHTFDDPTQPGGVAAVGELVGMVDVREATLSLYDTERLERIGRLPAGDGPTHVAADRRGQLLVADTRGGALIRYAIHPELRELDRTPLPGAPYGIVYDEVRDRLWVTLTGRNELVGLDLSGGAPREAIRFPTVRQPNTVAVDSATGRVFVGGSADGTLQFIDP